jgi:hypothetical protein
MINAANISAHLLFVSATRQISYAHCAPTKFCHQGRKVPVRAGRTLSLGNTKNVHQRLRADALQAVKASSPAHAFQAQAPRVYGLLSFDGRRVHFF